MSTNKTQHYQLHAWALGDEVPMSEFNENFTKLDAALKAEEASRNTALTEKAELVLGSYTGNYTGGDNQSRIIHLGFTPKAILVANSEGRMGWSSSSQMGVGGLALPGKPVEVNFATILEIVTNGFRVMHQSSFVTTNSSSETYYYIALR